MEGRFNNLLGSHLSGGLVYPCFIVYPLNGQGIDTKVSKGAISRPPGGTAPCLIDITSTIKVEMTLLESFGSG